MAKHIYKVISVLLLLYAMIAGLTMAFPNMGNLGHSQRNVFYHVPMWFTTIVMMGISVFQSVKFLRMIDPDYERTESPLISDAKAVEAAKIGVAFNFLGLVTGIIWSRVTWNAHLPSTNVDAWWGWDPIQICGLVSLLIYGGYFLLRSSFADAEQKAKMSAVLNIFAFATLIPLYFIVPKMFEGLHPTSSNSDAGGGSFLMGSKTIGGGQFRIIFWAGIFGFILLGIWVYELRVRLQKVALLLADDSATNLPSN